MKKTVRIMLGVAAVTAIGLMIFRKRRRNTNYMLNQVSDEGYETAHDVLFPRKSKRGKNIRYGPTLPS